MDERGVGGRICGWIDERERDEQMSAEWIHGWMDEHLGRRMNNRWTGQGWRDGRSDVWEENGYEGVEWSINGWENGW